MSSFRDFSGVRDNPEDQKRAIDAFVGMVDAGEIPHQHLLRFVADWLAGRVTPKRGRPETKRTSFKMFAAWFAAFCDPEFNTMPKSKGGRFRAVGEMLGCSENTARDRAKTFANGRCATDSLYLTAYSQRYWKLKKKEWNDEVWDELKSWYELYEYRRLIAEFEEYQTQ